MKKRIAALILACVLMTVPVLAAENTADNFTRTRTYAGEFSDLTSDSPFYENVTALYEYGLTVGKGDGTFGLTDTMTVGQIVIFAGRIHSLYCTGATEAGAAAQGGDGRTPAGQSGDAKGPRRRRRNAPKREGQAQSAHAPQPQNGGGQASENREPGRRRPHRRRRSDRKSEGQRP